MVDNDLFRKYIDIALRIYGDGRAFPLATVDLVDDYCRQTMNLFLSGHVELINLRKAEGQTYLKSLIYSSRHQKTRLQRLHQYLQAKERQEQENEDERSINQIRKRKRVPLVQRFQRSIQEFGLENNLGLDQKNVLTLDVQRIRQFRRLDAFYKTDSLTSKEYLLFVAENQNHLNQIRNASFNEILRWSRFSHRSLPSSSASHNDLRLSEVCLFLLKEVLLELMDRVFRSKKPSQVNDIFRRDHVRRHFRLPFSGRRRTKRFSIKLAQ